MAQVSPLASLPTSCFSSLIGNYLSELTELLGDWIELLYDLLFGEVTSPSIAD